MEPFMQVLKDTADMHALYNKQAKAERAKEILFPVMIITMVLIPIFLTVTGIGLTWLIFLLPIAMGLGFVILYACSYLWRRKDKAVRATYKQHIADSLALDLDLSQRQTGRKDTLKANREA